ncbi:MAG: Gfo/Idh/MocA family oxidoreductase [Actinobacteria bacterium]|nr:MAG: Gfo/Idh/MocA family oxidoreductase [Actinomycetota bacterium]
MVGASLGGCKASRCGVLGRGRSSATPAPCVLASLAFRAPGTRDHYREGHFRDSTRVGSAVKWGIVSTADINRKVIPGAHASEKVELLAVASRDQMRADAYAREWEIPRSYGSYEALLADPDVEAVYISLPNTMHVEWSIKALEAGKHVLCEKPFTRHPEEVDTAFDAAERTGRLLSEAFMYRHNPQTKKLAELVQGGAIGELRLVRSAFSYSLYDPENIRLRTDVEGGALMDVGCYCVSGSRLLGGEPVAVHGEAWYGPSGTDWVFGGLMRFPDDVVATFDCGTALPNRDELEAIGSEGSLFLDDPWHCVNPEIELRRDGGVERIEIERQDSYRLELENVSDAIRGELELLLGREDALGQARTLAALHDDAFRG